MLRSLGLLISSISHLASYNVGFAIDKNRSTLIKVVNQPLRKTSVV